MLVGTFHLANNNRDLLNLPIEDVLAPNRQSEIDQLIESLANWQPTKIVLEWNRADQARLDQRYNDFLSGEFQLTANERDQIGLRLAKKLGLQRVYAVDWNENAPGDDAAYDFLSWAKSNGADDRLKAFLAEGQKRLDHQAEVMHHQSITEWYRDLNSPEARELDHRQYFEIATFGDNKENPGAAWVGAWYARNLRIFNNIRELSDPGDRVLVLYGAGHIYLLDRFLRESDAAASIDPLPYLEPE